MCFYRCILRYGVAVADVHVEDNRADFPLLEWAWPPGRPQCFGPLQPMAKCGPAPAEPWVYALICSSMQTKSLLSVQALSSLQKQFHKINSMFLQTCMVAFSAGFSILHKPVQTGRLWCRNGRERSLCYHYIWHDRAFSGFLSHTKGISAVTEFVNVRKPKTALLKGGDEDNDPRSAWQASHCSSEVCKAPSACPEWNTQAQHGGPLGA